MAWVTEVEKTYLVTGTNIFAWNDYIFPAEESTKHARGESTQKGFSLENETIKVKEYVNRIEEGHVKDSDEKKPYEIVKATVDGKEGKYYAWVVYAGIVKVTLKETVQPPPAEDPPPPEEKPSDTPPQEEPKDEPPPSDKPTVEPTDTPKVDPIPKPPEAKPGDAHIEVHSGQTVVVEIKSDAKGSGKGTTQVETGSFEITLTDKDGNPHSTDVYLSGSGGIFTITVNADGVARQDNIPVGSYSLSLEKPAESEKTSTLVKLDQVVYFTEKSAKITADGARVIDEVLEYLNKPENNTIKKIEFKGYAGEDGSKQYKDNLKLQRAVAVKNNLSEKLSQSGTSAMEKTTSLGAAETDQEPEQYRRVEFLCSGEKWLDSDRRKGYIGKGGHTYYNSDNDGKPFSTIDEAAVAAIKEIRLREDMDNNKYEYATKIYFTHNSNTNPSQHYYTRFVQGTGGGLTVSYYIKIPLSGIWQGDVHTHTPYDKSIKEKQFIEDFNPDYDYRMSSQINYLISGQVEKIAQFEHLQTIRRLTKEDQTELDIARLKHEAYSNYKIYLGTPSRILRFDFKTSKTYQFDENIREFSKEINNPTVPQHLRK